MILDKAKIKIFSQIGMRATFGMLCLELVKNNNNLMVCTADVSTSAGLDRYRKKYLDNYVDVGIAEQNLIGIASGLSNCGYVPFVYTISNFLVHRCFEQIRNDIDYHNLSVTVVSVGSGLGYGNLGYSHHAIQDFALMRSFPNTLIASPSNNQEVESSIGFLLKNPQPSYLRLDKALELNTQKKINSFNSS